MTSLGFNMVPSSPDLDWETYFEEYAVQLAAAKAERAGEPVDGEEDEEEVEGFTVTEVAVEVGVSDLGTKAKAVFLAAAALGWEPRAWRSRTHHEPVLFASVSKEGAAKHHDAGDVRWPGYEQRTYQIQAKSPSAPVAFRAFWAGKGEEGKTGSWSWGQAIDPIGVPIENHVDYSFSSAHKTPVEVKQLERRAYSLNFDYNDASTRMETRPLFRSAADFTVWLDEWLDMLAPDHKKLTPVKKEKPAEPAFPDLSLGEWSAE